MPPAAPRRGRARRWARRAGAGVLVILLLATLFSLGYNALTGHRRQPPAGLTYVDAGGVRTRYRAWGLAGSPVVLVHGAAESADTWYRLAPLLAGRHRVYAYDVVGWGYTRHTGHYTLADQARQLLAVLDAFGLRRALLVGHSSGAAVVAEAALLAPERVDGVMFLDGDALATGPGARSPASALVLPPYRTTVLRLAVRSDGLVRSLYTEQCGPTCPRLDAAGVDEWRRPFQVAGAESALWSMLRLGVPGLPAARLRRLAALPMPKAVVFGAGDRVFRPGTPQDTARRIGAPPPTLIDGARHLSMIGRPDQVATAVEDLALRAPIRA